MICYVDLVSNRGYIVLPQIVFSRFGFIGSFLGFSSVSATLRFWELENCASVFCDKTCRYMLEPLLS